MGSAISSGELDSQGRRLRDITAEAAEWLCLRSWPGLWGDARTNSSAVWALCHCGLAHSHREFIEYALEQLLNSDECKVVEETISFNYEVWDSSVGLIALDKGGADRFSSHAQRIADWLLAEASDDHFKYEPWETLWGVYALMLSAKPTQAISPVVRSCIRWLLKRRTADGILISPHYMGFLSSVLTQALLRFSFSQAERDSLQAAIDKCMKYLKSEYTREKKKGRLWGDQPWVIGHILAGIATCEQGRRTFFDDVTFNAYLSDWLEQHWDHSDGWVDVLDTANLLTGLCDYYVEFELMRRGRSDAVRLEVVRELSSTVRYRFDPEKVSPQMTVHPIWRSRVRTNDRACFILMPFGQPWSPGILELLRSTLTACGFTAIRADDYYGGVIVEDVWKGINEARIIIAECSPPLNPNVAYELGIAHTLGKDVIMISQSTDASKTPLDLRHFRHIPYTNDDQGYRRLREEIPKHINAIVRGL